MPRSWRPISDVDPARVGDAVVVSESMGSSRRHYDAYTYGELIGGATTLAGAKRYVEEVYGPLSWRMVKNPPVEVVHYYYGPTTEFTEPPTLWVVDRLPKLGSRKTARVTVWPMMDLREMVDSLDAWLEEDEVVLGILDVIFAAMKVGDIDLIDSQTRRLSYLLKSTASTPALRFIERLNEVIRKMLHDPAGRVPKYLVNELRVALDATHGQLV